jgi:anti-anti-sigma factor
MELASTCRSRHRRTNSADAAYPAAHAWETPVTVYESWADQGVGVVEVTGDLDSTESVAFHAAIRSAVDQARAPLLVIACFAINHIALGPISVVISTSQALRARGGQVALAGPDARIRRVLRIGGITDIESFPTLEVALTAIGGRRDLG